MFALGQKRSAVSFNESMPIGAGKNFIGPGMNVIHFRNNGAFDAEATEAMGRAFESVCHMKPNVSRELIANRIIQLARAGERDPTELAAQVLNELKARTPSENPRRVDNAAEPPVTDLGTNFKDSLDLGVAK